MGRVLGAVGQREQLGGGRGRPGGWVGFWEQSAAERENGRREREARRVGIG